MRKNQIIAAFALFTALCVILISCQSTGKKKTEEKFTVDLDSPQFQIGEVEFQLKPIMGIGKIKKRTATVHYFPKEDAVAVRVRPDFTTFNQCWSKSGRQNFIDALKMYNDDYDARALEIKAKKTERKYGLAYGYLIWQQFEVMVRAQANMYLEFGYKFNNKTPYFVVNQLVAEFTHPSERDLNRKTQVMPYFFTRAQAAELAALFDPDFLSELEIPAFMETKKGIGRFFNNYDTNKDNTNKDDSNKGDTKVNQDKFTSDKDDY